MSTCWRALLGIAWLATALVVAPAASAKKITRGEVAPPDQGGCSDCNDFQLTTDREAGSPSYKVPKGKWRIIRWSAQGGGSGGDGAARMRVYRKTDVGGQYELVKQSDEETIPGGGSPKFATSLRVKHGDRLGIFTTGNVAAGYSSPNDGDVEGRGGGCGPLSPGDLIGTGGVCPVTEAPGSRTNVWAKLKKL